MSTFVVEGGHRLEGTIYPQGAKNEALEVICAVLLTPERVVIENIPDILDVRNLISLLKALAAVVLARISSGFRNLEPTLHMIPPRRYIRSRSATD